MGSEIQLDEMIRLLSKRDYYSSAKLRAGILREGSDLKLIGAKCILSSEKEEESRELDYGSLILAECGLSKDKFRDWLTRLVKEGIAEFGKRSVSVKGDFVSRSDLSLRVLPSGGQLYAPSPVDWACTFFRYYLVLQSSLPYSLEPKVDLPFFPDGRVAWGEWTGIDPERGGDIFGSIIIYLPNMAGRILDLDVIPKSKPKKLVVSVLSGLDKAATFKGKAFVQEAYDNTPRPRRSVAGDLSFAKNKAEIGFGFKPGHASVILFDKNDEVLDFRRGFPLSGETATTAVSPATGSIPVTFNPKEVFVVHGRDEGGKDAVCRLLERSGLEAIVLKERPHRGRTLIEKLEDYGGVGYAVVILSGDDVGGLHNAREMDQLNLRARQNVIFELGIFLGKLGRGRVSLLYKKGVEIPSDLSGLGYVEMDEGGAWRMRLAREMDAAGISIDMKRVAELS